jgi:hypothetical protein
MKWLALAGAGLVAVFTLVACKDSPPTVTVYIECDRADSWTPESEQEYSPGISISYDLAHYSGSDEDFAVASKGVHEEDRYYGQQRFYRTCRVFMGNSARDGNSSPPDWTHVLIECSGKPSIDFINAHFDKAGEVERPLDFNLNYKELDKSKTLSVQVSAASASFFWEWVDYGDCSAHGTMIEELRD